MQRVGRASYARGAFLCECTLTFDLSSTTIVGVEGGAAHAVVIRHAHHKHLRDALPLQVAAQGRFGPLAVVEEAVVAVHHLVGAVACNVVCGGDDELRMEIGAFLLLHTVRRPHDLIDGAATDSGILRAKRTFHV